MWRFSVGPAAAPAARPVGPSVGPAAAGVGAGTRHGRNPKRAQPGTSGVTHAPPVVAARAGHAPLQGVAPHRPRPALRAVLPPARTSPPRLCLLRVHKEIKYFLFTRAPFSPPGTLYVESPDSGARPVSPVRGRPAYGVGARARLPVGREAQARGRVVAVHGGPRPGLSEHAPNPRGLIRLGRRHAGRRAPRLVRRTDDLGLAL